jgi:hypothetical protein
VVLIHLKIVQLLLFQYYNYLSTTLNPNRYFPTGSGEKIGVISIPSNLWGEYLQPGTVSISNGTTTFTDDGEGNMISGSLKYGDVIYEHGIIILTSNGISGSTGYGVGVYGSIVYGLSSIDYISNFITGSDITCSFNSTVYLKVFLDIIPLLTDSDYLPIYLPIYLPC